MVLMTCRMRPSKGCRSRSIVTEREVSRRWVVCDGFLRYDSAQRVDEVSGSPDCGRRSAAADQAVAESADRGTGWRRETTHEWRQEQRTRHAARRRRKPAARQHLHEPLSEAL